MNKTYTEKITGTGSAITVKPGFKPSSIDIHNLTGLCSMTFVPDHMTAGRGLKHVTDGTISYVTASGGVYINSDNMPFTIGTDTDINVSGEILNVVAFR